MKYLKDINECQNMEMVAQMSQIARNPLKLNNYYMMTGEQAPVKDEYYEGVVAHCLAIAKEFVNDSSTEIMERVNYIANKAIVERQDEFDTIVHNCKQRNFRPQYCAETEFHTIIQGRLVAMNQRPFAMGGLQVQTPA